MKKNNLFLKILCFTVLIKIPVFALAANQEVEPQPKTIRIIKSFCEGGPDASRGRFFQKEPPLVAEGLENAKILQLMEKANIPGLAIAVIRNGEPIWIHGFGRKNVNTQEEITPDTVFEAASLTKPLFAYLVMKMVEKGDLDLDTPLVNYVPADYLEKKVLHHSLKFPGFRWDWFKTITARMILSHSAGLPLGAHSNPLPILFQPGTQFKYSANGYLFLQFIVEYIKKQPLEKIIDNEVFKPLGMTRSSMVWQNSYETSAAVGHNFIGETTGKFRKRVLAVSASSLYTTINDYTAFITAFLKNKGIRPDTKNKMLEPQIKINNELSWSLGFGIEKTQKGDAFWQWGDFEIYQGYLNILREQMSGVIYFTNSSNGLSIVRDIMELVFGYGEHPSISWLDYESYNTPRRHFIDIIKEKTPDQLQDAIETLREKYPDYFTQSKMADLGSRLLYAGKYKAAATVFQVNVKNHPQSGNAYESLAESYLYLKEDDLVILNYKRAWELDSQNRDAWQMLKFMDLLKMINHSDMAAAQQLYKDLHKKYSQDIGENQLRRFGQLLHNANRLEEAMKIFQLNLKAYPSSSQCFLDLAGVYHSMGNVTSARYYCRKALELEPDNMEARFLLESL